ncbi:hypothetical protein L195_g016461 [Trifolium pratense]|uniref:Uncharacterized protein n=1 Tax=Trifolium pratense TaxID=57577 RepID=A0A2K3MR69_TRIPR|nr:hypothetical protein L195_g016461 [Trifolium pratense]
MLGGKLIEWLMTTTRFAASPQVGMPVIRFEAKKSSDPTFQQYKPVANFESRSSLVRMISRDNFHNKQCILSGLFHFQTAKNKTAFRGFWTCKILQ